MLLREIAAVVEQRLCIRKERESKRLPVVKVTLRTHTCFHRHCLTRPPEKIQTLLKKEDYHHECAAKSISLLIPAFISICSRG